MLKTYTASLIGASLLATAAFAQSPSTPSTTSPSPSPAPAATAPAPSATDSKSASSMSYQGNWRTSKLVGLNVYNEGNESLGSINDLLTDKSGNIKAVVIGVGGFLGVGERYVAIPFDKVKFVNEPVVAASASTTTAPGGAMTRPTGSTTGAATGTTPPAPATSAVATKNPWYPDHAVISATKDELKSMAEFKYTTAN